MRSRMGWRKSGEVPTLWLRCTLRGLLHEDEIRSVEGPDAGRGGPEGGGNGAPEREKRKCPPAYPPRSTVATTVLLAVWITDTVPELRVVT